MPTKDHNPTSPGRRFYTKLDRSDIDRKKKPEKNLTKSKKKTGGRNSSGRITARHRGGGAKQKVRQIDFKRNKDGVPARVAAIEYAPARSSHIALLNYADGEKRYILAPMGLSEGATVQSGSGIPARVGNSMPISDIAVGTVVHAVELVPGKGAQLARSAGTFAQVVAKEGSMATLRLPSSEMRMVSQKCRATIGRVGNVDHQNIQDGKAGRKRDRGRRPHVRGSAMNPVDHPHGGGEGKAPIGLDSPRSPWGKRTLGKHTRRGKKESDKYIVRRRK
ncbi:MAG: 50S ribosomal protein L2 [Armatimonadota bacterium]